jgi:predicted nucleic acid-binding protein
MFLDTTFLINLEEELENNHIGPARRFLAGHRNERHAVSVVAMGEVAAGMVASAQARSLLSKFRVVTLKPEIALAAADVDRQLMRQGARLGENDNWIAGFAVYYGVPLVSNDLAFDRVRGLRRLAY